MKKTKRFMQAGGALLAISVSTFAMPKTAHAQSADQPGAGSALTPSAVQSQLNALQQEVNELQHQQAEMKYQEHERAIREAKAEAGGWHLKGNKNSVIPEFVSADGESWMKIGGVIQIDTAINQPPQKGSLPTGGARINSAFRRLRLEVEGQIDRNWIYKLEYDFTGSTAADGIEDAYVGWHGKIGKVYNIFLFGNQHVPFGLQTPSNYRTWMELPLASDVFRPAREFGVTGQSSQKHWNFWYGVFDGRNPNNSGKPYGEPGTLTASGDFAINVINEPGRVFRIGNSLQYQEYGPSGELFDTFPDSKEYGADLVATPEMLGARSNLIYSPNIAFEDGPLTFHASYYFVPSTGTASETGATPAASLKNEIQGKASFSGWDVQAEYFLTGEVRPYDTEAGNYVGVKPLHPITEGGWGAWQIKGRIDSVDLNDRQHDVMGGRETNLEVGVNWYPTSYTRVDLEYVKVLKVDGGPYNGYSPSIVQGRLQFVF